MIGVSTFSSWVIWFLLEILLKAEVDQGLTKSKDWTNAL